MKVKQNNLKFKLSKSCCLILGMCRSRVFKDRSDNDHDRSIQILSSMLLYAQK